ncbi:DUF2683 family protein [archaeon]|jgi:hypothetical protein|nr:DUF2683 family protein [archaeon]
MVQTIISLDSMEDRVLNIVKARHGLKNKSQAIATIVKVYADNFLEPSINPLFVKKMKKTKKQGYGKTYISVKEAKEDLVG